MKWSIPSFLFLYILRIAVSNSSIQTSCRSSSQLKLEESSNIKDDEKVKNDIKHKEKKTGQISPRRLSTLNAEKDKERTYIKKVFYKDPIKHKTKKPISSVLSKSTNEFKRVKNKHINVLCS